jgi:hypothetical protein
MSRKDYDLVTGRSVEESMCDYLSAEVDRLRAALAEIEEAATFRGRFDNEWIGVAALCRVALGKTPEEIA